MDFLFHKVSEKEKQEIKEQAKSIMDDFSNKLSKIDPQISQGAREGTLKRVREPAKQASKKISEPLIERAEGERGEEAPQAYPEKSSSKIFTRGKEKTCDEEFRKIMFENAPEKNKDFIIAEKKSW